MVEKSDVVGKPTGASTLHVERGPLTNFAAAVTDDNPIYRDPAAAADAGFDSLPAPPTFTFALQNWGRFPEDQPEDPTDGTNPMADVMIALMAEGGLVLHGEQEFVYHRPVVAGDTLHHEGRITDLYTKESKGRTMTFLVIENVFRDEAGEPVVTEYFNLIHRS